MRYALLPTPLGALLVGGSEVGLELASFQDGDHPTAPEPGWTRDDGAFATVAAQVGDYFAGRPVRFELRLAPRGTAFQQAVWAALRDIPWGHTASYGELAGRIGRPTASRAVGLANGRNPLPLFVPCHRVVGARGALVGYGGGLWIKERLLAIERGDPQARMF